MNELFHVLITYGGIRKSHVKGKKRFTNTTSAVCKAKVTYITRFLFSLDYVSLQN